MLQIKNISKQYKTGEFVQDALKDVSLNLRENEFVAILGPSGSGKTTLLNIIGGLDRYDSGDLIIDGISTKDYHDRDWDTYRNHSIGFVFQTYNLIPHQSILANVELALTIGGVSRTERRKRALRALEEVGLSDHIHKIPNQMSGGQMQRVAIARALVNDPDILLADEPTGALDTETSIQVMELLKQVADKRLVVMVTHNSELAAKYATRVVRLRDGQIVHDTNTYKPDRSEPKRSEDKFAKKTKMSFFTSLSLSFSNLKTKKGRTILTSFAGSIGIIGIALILALSTGLNTYIADMQKETMTSYPITINSETLDMSGFIGIRGSEMGRRNERKSANKSESKVVFADNTQLEIEKTFSSSVTENDLTAFKKYLDKPDSEINQYIGENGVVYSYDVSFNVYSYDKNGKIVNSDADTENLSSSSEMFDVMIDNRNQMISNMTTFMGLEKRGAENFSQLMPGVDDKTIGQVITDNYQLLYGTYPENYDEVLLVLNSRNGISTDIMYQLGFITKEEYLEIINKIDNGEKPEDIKFDYETICRHVFYVIPACDYYEKNEEGTFAFIGDDSIIAEQLCKEAVELKITGIVRPIDTSNISILTAVAYTYKLTNHVIDYTDKSDVVLSQEKTPDINVLTGMNFEAQDDDKKIEDATNYISKLSISNKAALYRTIIYYSSANETGEKQDPSLIMAQNQTIDETTMAALLDRWLYETADREVLISIYDQYIKGSSYEDNMIAFGKMSYDTPSSISIYVDSFENKTAIAESIADYNETVDENTKIVYTDYVEMMTSSLTSIIDVISYLLIAFVSVSLVVSSIMIGIITHISVLERTKEIGILRALGASKRNISQVFNAETVIIGFCAGLIGVGTSLILTIPINAVIHHLLGTSDMSAMLPPASALILVTLSVVVTTIGGLYPAKIASTKDPVIALRTE